jgi:hypothetical protein
MTHWVLEGEVGVEIVNFLDDHSRLCLASRAVSVTKVLDVMTIFQGARERYGTPASVLTDIQDKWRPTNLHTVRPAA